MSALEEMVAALSDPQNYMGQRVEVQCPDCAWQAHGYMSVGASSSAEEAKAWLLAQHECGTSVVRSEG